MHDKRMLDKIVNFVSSFGIDIKWTNLNKTCVLPGLSLGSNTIWIDKEKLEYPGDILHEAGHLSVCSPGDRNKVDSLKDEKNWPTDGEEIASILWSFAAARHLEIPLNIVFHEGGYKKDSKWLIDQFENGVFIGLPLLSWMGLCNDKDFPKMKKWIR